MGSAYMAIMEKMGKWVVLVLLTIVLVLPHHCSSAASFNSTITPSPPAPIPSAALASVTVRCYVVDGTVIVIPSTVPNQTRQDILYSLLLAQLAANHNYSHSSANENWVKVLNRVLLDIDWLVVGESFGDLIVKSSHFTIPNLALHRMGVDLVMKTHLETYIKIMSELQKLPTSSAARNMIQNRTYSSTSHDAAVMFCTVDHSSSFTRLSVLMIALSGVKDSTSYTLVHNYKTKSVKRVKELVSHHELDEDIYSRSGLRQKIINKLGSRVKTGIVEVKLSLA